MEVMLQTQHDIPFFASELLSAAGGIAHGFSTRIGGVSTGMWDSLNLGISRGDNPDHVKENYRRFLSVIGAKGEAVAMCDQVHGNKVLHVTTADCKTDPYTKIGLVGDGLMTAVPGIALTIFSADCIPVLLFDPKRRVIAALHAGWRGTAAGVVTAAVTQMIQVYGSNPADILAAIGPGIDQCCFETHEDVPNAMTAALAGNSLPSIHLKENGKFSVDLKGINARRLEMAGLSTDHITVCHECTCCQPDSFWSHRRQGTQRGSMAAVIQLI